MSDKLIKLMLMVMGFYTAQKNHVPYKIWEFMNISVSIVSFRLLFVKVNNIS